MSFGFSVGDVILLSQLSVQIYRTVTTGRRNASRDLQELADILFGFQCALDHLSNVADQISKDQDSLGDEDASSKATRSKLDQMIRNCATTLEDLDTATKKYREVGQPDSVESSDVQSTSAVAQRASLKRRLASNIMRIRWDIDKDTLRIYRDKLQAHTDAINLVLNTFVWSTTQKIHEDNKNTALKLTDLHDQVASSNKELTQLLKSVALTASIKTASSGPEPSISAHIVQSAASTKTSLASSGSIQADPKAPASDSLPAHIQALNAERLARPVPTNAPKNSRKLGSSVVAEKPSNLTDPATVTSLIQQLEVVLPQNVSPNLASHGAKITTWISQLNALLDSRIWGGASKKENQDLVEIVVQLNEAIESADSKARELFYRYSKDAKIDFVLGKICEASGSVRARQQVEEFAEVREDWEGERWGEGGVGD